ncbi:DeoR/GlpR family DNA-binding transcription regulator [Fusobacterium sp.]|uniref:DeoR/GlpR family DNA-binding transcription regulator n=1 Tax=Fusobacterium sp. TaxID=68766 RepID=UPI0029023180|nr:DeoR/GlpR family DNA-binding transcription regulator [Fusobacterium sp.]MDU1910087.1 DeoR/GlpR family DNA-binding transcription regulator [Fusobacterium sp.]
MRFNERKALIINTLKKQQILSFPELELLLSVSPTTIRRDLTALEKEGILSRFHGGIKKNNGIIEQSMSKKQSLNIEAKKKIGKIAASLIHPNELIFIGSGSTTYYMINYIKDTSITVITNGIPHAEALNAKNIRAFLLCGFLKDKTRSVVGKETNKLIESYHFDQVFSSANGMNADFDILSTDEYEHNIKKSAVSRGKVSYIMIDSSKFNKTAMYTLPRNKDTYIITESLTEELKKIKNVITPSEKETKKKVN